jgi:hypothetical protein
MVEPDPAELHQIFRLQPDREPAVVERLSSIRKGNRVGVAHEFFNADWEPMPFSQVAGLLAPADVSFAVSGNLVHHLDGLSMPPASRKLLGEIDHPILRESVRDYLINASFRRDIFVKGGKTMPGAEQLARYLKQGFVRAKSIIDQDPWPTVCAMAFWSLMMNAEKTGVSLLSM